MRTFTLLSIFILFSGIIFAQTSVEDQVPYRRSSLYTFLIKTVQDSEKVNKEVKDDNALLEIASSFGNTEREMTADDSIPKSELIFSVFNSIEIPDQFNNHNLAHRIMDYDQMIQLKIEDKKPVETQKKKKSGFGGVMKGLGRSALSVVSSGAISEEAAPNINDSIPTAINNFFAINNIPTHIVGKWYNYTGEQYEHPLTKTPTYYNMDLIAERGVYNASESDLEKAQFNARNMDAIRDAGDELIPNTFVMGLRLKYISREELLAQSQATARGIAGIASELTGVDAGVLSLAVEAGGAVAGATMGDGYYVQATSYLYQLVWNEEKQKLFENQLDKPLDELIESGVCELHLIGQDKSSAGVRSRKFSKKPESELIKRATARSIDAVIAKLQSEYDVFKTKCKISHIDEDGTIYAKIGLKEGLGKDDEYEVLERIIDKETQKATYQKVGTIKVAENKIWDNRYGAEDEMAEDQEFGGEEVTALTATAFSGKIKDVHPGMYLRLEKKKKSKSI